METNETTIDVILGGDGHIPEAGEIQAENDLTKYNQQIYLKPVWEGDTVYHEAALFYTGRESIKLLYPISNIISLRSYDLKTCYVEGVDYVIENGLIRRLPDSNIPVYTKGLTVTDPAYEDGSPYKAFPTNAAGTEWIKFIWDQDFPAAAIAVTYKHNTEWQDGYHAQKPASQREKLSSFLQKLENGETVNIALIGDSESCGWSSSGLNYPNSIYDETDTEGNFKTNYVINIAPYAPTWMDLFVSELGDRYPDATINFKNLALGGKDAAWGALHLEKRIALWDKTPDLFMIGFGGNDLTAGVSPASYKASTLSMMNQIRSNIKNGNPNAEILLLAPKIANSRILKYSVANSLPLEQQLIDLADSMQNVAVAKTTTLFSNVVKSKEAVDYLNTNVNHGNDFFARIYTQNLLAILTEDSATSL